MNIRVWFAAVFLAVLAGYGGLVAQGAESADAQDSFLKADLGERVRMVRDSVEQTAESIRLGCRFVLAHTPEFMQDGEESRRHQKLESGNDLTYVRIGSRTRTEARPLEKAAAGLEPVNVDPELDIYDGEVALHWFPGTDSVSSVGKASISRRPPRSILEESGPAGLFAMEEASVEDVLAAKGVDVAPSDTTVLGTRTIEVSGVVTINEVGYKATYWLAPDRGFLALRAEIRALAGHLVRSQEVKAVKQLANGAWWPMDVELREFEDDPDNPYHANTLRWTVGEVVLNPEVQDPDVFFSTSTDWLPPGVYVNDNVINEAYVVYGGAMADDVIDGIVGSFVNQQPDRYVAWSGSEASPASGVPSAGEKPVAIVSQAQPHSATLLLRKSRGWLGLLIVGGVVLMVLYRFRRTQRASA